MAIDPRELMSAVSERAHRGLDEPPAPLTRSAEAPSPLPPVRQAEEMAAIHREWARVHAGDRDVEPSDGGTGAPGMRAKVRARVVTAAGALSAQRDDRALIGDLIRSADALARRVDELAVRLYHLEALVQEVVDVTSEELVRVHALLASATGGQGISSGSHSPVAGSAKAPERHG